MLSVLFIQLGVCVLTDSFSLTGEGIDQAVLQSLRADVLILENTAQTTFELTYLNRGTEAIEEAKLKFPYDPKMAVSDVILEIGNKTFISQALEISEASHNYEQHKEAHQTALLVQRRSDFLLIQLAILPPGKTATVRLTAVTVLPTLFSAQRESWYSHYVLPLSFVPRYTPANQDWREVESLKGTSSVDYSFSFSFSAPFSSAISCPSYPNAVIEDGTRISYSGPLTRDLIVDITYPKIPHPIIERHNKTQITQFVFDGLTLPEEFQVAKPSIVFLVDCSGSMGGRPIEAVRTTLSLFLHSLPSDCEFDIVRFGSDFRSLFQGKRAYSDESLKVAVDYVKRMDADMGGTNVFKPLEYILKDIQPQYLFFLTDGAVSNTQEIKELVGRYKTRISTLGIGNSASVDLVRGIAELTGGFHEFIDDPDGIADAVIRSLSDTIKSALVNVSVVSNCGVSYERIPSSLSRSRLQAFTFFSPTEFGQCEMKLRGTLGNGTEFVKVLDVSEGHSMYSKALHSAFVITASDFETMNYSATIEFAQNLNLMTRYTGLLLYDNSTKHERVNKVTVDIPVYYGSWDQVGRGSAPSLMKSEMHDMCSMAPIPSATSLPDVKDVRKSLIDLSELQSAEGFWSDLAAVCNLLEIPIPEGKWTPEIMATAVAVANLRAVGAIRFGRIVEKGIEWLTKQLGSEETSAILNWGLARK